MFRIAVFSIFFAWIFFFFCEFNKSKGLVSFSGFEWLGCFRYIRGGKGSMIVGICAFLVFLLL